MTQNIMSHLSSNLFVCVTKIQLIFLISISETCWLCKWLYKVNLRTNQIYMYIFQVAAIYSTKKTLFSLGISDTMTFDLACKPGLAMSCSSMVYAK